jgi:hypothetical protein
MGLIMKVVDKGSVITIDCGVEILAKLAAMKSILKQLSHCCMSS